MPLRVREHKNIYRKAYKKRPEVRLRENERERIWRQTPEGKQRKCLYVERGKQRSNARWRERYATEITFRIRHALRARLRLAPKHCGIVTFADNRLRCHAVRITVSASLSAAHQSLTASISE